MKGKITICQSHFGDGTTKIHIAVRENDSGIEFLDGYMSVEDFGAAVTGKSFSPIEFELRGLNKVGKKFEHKEEVIKMDLTGVYNDEKRLELAKEAVKKFEKDGWKARIQDVCNGRNINYNQKTVLISFERWV